MGEIVRVFRVVVPADQQSEFEEKFATISVGTVRKAEGSLECTIGRPTEWAPEEYVMISRWRDIESLIRFAGDTWNQAVIPHGMEQFITSCELHHYEVFD